MRVRDRPGCDPPGLQQDDRAVSTSAGGTASSSGAWLRGDDYRARTAEVVDDLAR